MFMMIPHFIISALLHILMPLSLEMEVNLFGGEVRSVVRHEVAGWRCPLAVWAGTLWKSDFNPEWIVMKSRSIWEPNRRVNTILGAIPTDLGRLDLLLRRKHATAEDRAAILDEYAIVIKQHQVSVPVKSDDFTVWIIHPSGQQQILWP